MHPHYYPPASIEGTFTLLSIFPPVADPPFAHPDRLDQIVIPLLNNIAAEYKTSPVPDIVSIAPGFWGILRLSYEEQRIRDESILAGNQTIYEAYAEHDTWDNMKSDQRDWMEGRIGDVLQYVGNGWKGSVKAPLILWRAFFSLALTSLAHSLMKFCAI